MNLPSIIWWKGVLDVARGYFKEEEPNTTEEKMIYERLILVQESIEDLLKVL